MADTDLCPEEPWGDETGCTVHDDLLHRCRRFPGDHRGHLCECGAMAIEDRP